MSASISEIEKARLAALENLGILDTSEETAYDDLTQLAAYICQAPIALVSLVDKDRQWFKSRFGLDATETPRNISFCAHAIKDPTHLMEVPDATQDARFASNALVISNPNIRFYAGAPLTTPEGHALGTLCVIDHVPRHLSDEQRAMLERLSRQVVAQMQLRQRVSELQITTSKYKETAENLRRSDEQFQLFMNNSPILAFIKDETWRYAYVNSALLTRFNLTRADIIGKTDYDLWPEVADTLRANDEGVMKGNSTVRVEEETPMPSGPPRYWLSYKFPLDDNRGHRMLAGTALDITDRKFYEGQMQEYQGRLEEAIRQLEELALTDSLTGLRNKASFSARIEEEISRARRYHLPLSLLMLDIDHFKKINDDFGHQAGDEVLRCTALILRNAARPSDFVARYGGEEFTAVLPNTDAQGAYLLAERLRQTVEEQIVEPRPLTISIGVASLTPGESTRSLVARADKALYDAKNSGRNRVATAELTAHESPFAVEV